MKKRKKKIENQKIRIIIIKNNKNKPNKPEESEKEENRSEE